MSRYRSFLCILVLAPALALGSAKPAPAQDFFFHNGDKPVVFLGDSITAQKMYTTYIEDFVLSRYPTWDVSFRNAGWGGDTASLMKRGDFESSLKRDVLSLKPAAVTIDFGMNDAHDGDDGCQKYIDYSTKLVERLKAAGARVALLTSNSVELYVAGEPGGSSYNHMLWRYSQALRDVATKENVPFVDQYTPFMKAFTDGRSAGVLGATGPPRITFEGYHPNWGGHLVMATAILKGLNAPPLVSNLEIDAAGGKVVVADGCTAENLTNAAGTVSFKRTDSALPWFVPDGGRFVLKIPGFTPLDDLSRYTLKVTGLTASGYDLTIDGVKAAGFTKDELATGVNLTLLPSPITDQSDKLFQAIKDKNNTYYKRWLDVQVYEFPAWAQTATTAALQQSELDTLDAQIADQEKQINALRAPVPHVFKLTPVAPPAA